MVRRLLAYAAGALVLAVGCTDGEGSASTSAGSASASSSGTSTTAASASASASSTSASGSTTTSTGSTTQATTTQATTTQGSTTTPVTTSSSSSPTTGVDTGVETTGDPTGDTTGDPTGGPDACADLGDVDFGPCEAIVGWVYDGEGCVLRSGCGCEPHCASVHESAQGCALTCAGAGACATEKMKAAGIAADPFVVGSFCDGVHVCGGDEADLLALFPGQPWEAKGGYPCEGMSMCTAYYQGIVDETWWSQLCAASLLPGVTTINCVVWGP